MTLLQERGLINNTIASELEHKMHNSAHSVNALGMKEAAELVAAPLDQQALNDNSCNNCKHVKHVPIEKMRIRDKLPIGIFDLSRL